MAIASNNNIGPWPIFPLAASGAPTFGSNIFRLNSATDDCTIAFQAPLTGDITDIAFGTQTVTTGCTLDVRLEDLDTSTGLKSGTLVNAGANVSQVIADADDTVWFEVTLGTAGTVTEGDALAVVFDVSSGTPSALNFSVFTDGGLYFGFPYLIENDGTSTWISGNAPCFAVKYSGVGWVTVPGAWPIVSHTATAWNSGSATKMYGARFQLSHQQSASHCWFWGDPDQDFSIKLYDSDGTTVLATASAYTNTPPNLTPGLHAYKFDDTLTIVKDTTYYLMVAPSTTTPSLTMYSLNVPSTNMRGVLPGGPQFYQVTTTTLTPTGTGDFTADQDKWPCVGLFLDGIEEVGAGGGETSHVFAC